MHGLVISNALLLALLPTPRSPPPRLLFDWLRTVGPDYDAEELSPEAAAAVSDICCQEGWDLRCEIGSAVAKGLGGSGELAKGPTTGTAVLDICITFSLDEGYDPPQGPTRLRKSSRFFDDVGFWKVDADTDDGVPQQVQWRLQSGEGVELGGQALLPPGPVYFNALCRVQPDGSVALEKGRITVKEDIGVNTGIFQGRGILAEFKIVGSFEVKRGSGGV